MAENKTPQSQVSEVFNIKEFFLRCFNKWYLFVASVAICLGVASFYMLKTPKVYSRKAVVLIKETYARRQSSDLESMLSTGGVSQMSSKLSNEIVAFESPDLMREVVKRLNLNVNYFRSGHFHDYVLYGSSLPVKLDLLGAPSGSSFIISREDSLYHVRNICFYSGGSLVKDAGTYTGELRDTVLTPIGGIVLLPNEECAEDLGFDMKVSCGNIESTTRAYSGRLHAEEVNNKNLSDILSLSITDQSPKRAEDVLRTLITVYNENWVDDRNKMAVSTSMFINERLSTIEKELGTVDSDISSYKSRNLIPDVQAVSGLYLTRTSEIDRQIQELRSQIYTGKFVRNYLTSSVSKNQMIPVSSGMADMNIANQIADYNRALLERNNLVAGSSESNPLVRDKDASLEAIRQSIISSVDNQIATLDAQVEQLQLSEQSAATRLAESPRQAKDLLGVERQQKVKESLYLFLLQKREENELSQAFTAYNTRIITQPTGSNSPTAPVGSKIFLIAFVIGLMLPVAGIYLLMVLDTKVRTRSDIEKLTAPFLGEIPQYYPSGKKKRFRLPWHYIERIDAIVVKHGKRDSINEAFRVLRTNLEFVCKGNGHNVIAVSSFNAGSGKTFTTVNIAAALSLKGLKVLVIDADLRHASMSKYVGSPAKGIVSYMSGDSKDVKKLICHPADCKSIDILPVGVLPPNPSEIVADARFEELVKSLGEQYDYVFLDCPPVEIVADAHIVDDYVDRTVFIIRAGLLEKQMLSELESYYSTSKFKNIGIVLNGTESEYTKYYSHRYGYYSYTKGHYYSSKDSYYTNE